MRKIIYILFLLLLIVGCKKTGKIVDTTTIETLDIEDCMDDAKDTCCEEKCMDFCQGISKHYAKHFVNGPHCPCWCD